MKKISTWAWAFLCGYFLTGSTTILFADDENKENKASTGGVPAVAVQSQETKKEGGSPEDITPSAHSFIMNGFADLAEKMMGAVVNVAIWSKPSNMEMPFPGFGSDSFLNDFLREFFGGRVRSQKPSKQKRITALGSGFIVRCVPAAQERERLKALHTGKVELPQTRESSKPYVAYVVTNRHVIESALRKESSFKQEKGTHVTVRLQTGEEVIASVVGSDPSCDVAVLCFYSNEPVPTLSWGDSSKIKTGHWVLAAGNPFGLGGTVTHGIVSHTKRETTSQEGARTYLQTDVSMNSGNSGGALIDMHGKVIGVNVAIYTPTGGSVGISLSIPSDLASQVVEQLIDKGVVTYGMVGLAMRGEAIYKQEAEDLKMPGHTKGVFVEQVLKGLPADKAGLRPGDVIVEVNGHEVESFHQVKNAISMMPIGKEIQIKVWRPSVSAFIERKVLVQQVELNLDRSTVEEEKETYLGLHLKEKANDKGETPSVMVSSVEEESPAFGLLKKDDVIQTIGLKPIRSIKEAARVLEDHKKDGRGTIIFGILRQGKEISILMTTGTSGYDEP